MKNMQQDNLHAPCRQSSHRGVTLTETIIGLGVVVAACAAAAPMLQGVQCDAARARSMANLMELNQAHAAYSANYDGAQYTIMPADYGAYDDCNDYEKQVGCIPPAIIGEDCDGYVWSYDFGCDGSGSSSCMNARFLQPIDFSGSSTGWFRRSNLAAFNAYVDGRYFDDTFWAPDDYASYESASKAFDVDCEFAYSSETGYPRSSYCLSPAALWHPDVLGQEYGGYRSPDTFAESYATPAVAECRYPELKTRLLEHNAVGRFWSETPYFNPLFGGDSTPMMFNHLANTRNLALFYDGSVSIMNVEKAVRGDQRVRRAEGQELGLWSRSTPRNYYEAQTYDLMENSSFHILTIDGIRGRDKLETGG